MNRPTLFVLLALNGLLAIVLVSESLLITDEVSPVQSSTQAKSDVIETPPELDLTQISEDSYKDLVDRPLFIKGRKPVDEPAPENAPVVVVKKVEAFVWDVTGIYTTPKGVTAFFSRTNTKVAKDNYRKYKIGEELDGWKLSEIHSDNVALTQAGETKVLQLRKPKPKTSAAVTKSTSSQTQKPVPAQAVPQETPPPNLQTTNVPQNVETPADENSVQAVQQQ